jgi:hypothetical protein
MAIPDVFFLKMDFAGQGQGWSEVFTMKSTVLTDAKTDAASLITGRLAMLSADIELVYANLTKLGIKRKSYAMVNDITPGVLASPAADANDVADCLLLRQETAAGDHANRFLHAPPDPSIVSGAYFPTGLAGYDTALAAFRASILSKTSYLLKPNKTDPTTWSLVAWTSTVIRGKTRHKVGRPFDERAGKRRSA